MIITEELLRSFARYEIAFEDLHIDNTKSIRYEDYELTLEDLEAVFDRILKEDIGWERFCEEWLIPVWWDEETAGMLFLFPMIPERENSFYDGLPYSDGEVALRVFAELNRYIVFEGKDCGELRDTASYLKELLRCYRENRNRELIDWDYPDSIKKNFVMAVYRRELDHMQIDEERRELFKRYLDELIDHKDAYAMKVKGDLHYGGSSFYPCDWNICRDLLERSFELEQDPYTANSLGYIYYYGRCNNGVPEYDKAFKCFTFGYIHHLYESAYKLADMYKGGKGVPKSMETYASMIEDLYDYALKDFCEGEDKSFADVALRMGSVVEDFYEEPKDAYAYYLQADYAIKKRSKMGYYGDDKVAGHIGEAL
ncbi:MAG: sel1 repeat family protein, partial [Erysipelotrichaceae bacterium]|nr:sel1 repeat family protein [Erysipelotrichaceae bacterium]